MSNRPALQLGALRQSGFPPFSRGLPLLGKARHGRDRFFSELTKRRKGQFEGNVRWYAETVKLDRQAREIIGSTSSKPQKYRVT
jgi:hypothetical protein